MMSVQKIGSRTQMRKLIERPLNSTMPSIMSKEGITALKQIDADILAFLEHCDPTIKENVILLINHIVILDKLSEVGLSSWENDDRSRAMRVLLELLEEFGASSSSLNLKESVYYYAACLCFKVHNYSSALSWFVESKNVYERSTAGKELSEIERLRRDIFIAFCHEYIGHPEKAIEFLLGISSIDIFETAIFTHKNEIVRASVNSECMANKFYFIRAILKLPEFTNDSVIQRTLGTTDIQSNLYQDEKFEIVHVFAHCLSEYRIKGEYFGEGLYGKAIFRNIIRLISKKLIDTLDDKYITCKATIRAEGDDYDEALKILPLAEGVTDIKSRAEINFYRFYFTELFSRMFSSLDDDTIIEAGVAFRKYCLSSDSTMDGDSKRDALLHYHIFEVKRKLRVKFEEILRSNSNRNISFLNLDFEQLDDTWKESFDAVTLKDENFRNGFSSFANSEIKTELRLLHLCLNILLEIKANKLPLFFSNDEQDKDFKFETNGNQLFELCKMFSAIFFKKTRPIIQSYMLSASKFRTYYINNLRFDILGDDYDDFEKWIEKLFDGEHIEYAEVELADQSSTSKIVFGNKDEVEAQCQQFNKQLLQNSKLSIRVFYVGNKNDDFIATPIVAFNDLKTCLLMAYIYATIETLLDYICTPRPIYILAPLRDTGSYYFQAVSLERFIPLYQESSDKQTIKYEGIGISPRYDQIKTNTELICDFWNNEIKAACCGALLYRDSKLYVLREDKFVEKVNVNHLLIQYCYGEYKVKRERARQCKAVHKSTQSICPHTKCIYCNYVFRSSNSLANQNATNNSIAAALLLDLVVIACKEDVVDFENVYVLENSMIYGNETKDFAFQIYLFNKDVSSFGCCNEWLKVDRPSPDPVTKDRTKNDAIDFPKEHCIWIHLSDLKKKVEVARDAANDAATRVGTSADGKETARIVSDLLNQFIDKIIEEIVHKDSASPRVSKCFFESAKEMISEKRLNDFFNSTGIEKLLNKLIGYSKEE